MVEIAFIVEGQMEQKAVQRLCPGRKVVLLGTGGRPPMSVVANFIETRFRVFNNRYYPVVILFDREDRKEACDKLRDDLEVELVSRGLQANQFIICVTNTDTETWLLAHLDEEGEFIETGTTQCNVDGASGQSEVRRRLSKKEIIYHKTTIGAEYLARIVPSVVATKSEVFRKFRDSLLPFCPWMAK